MFNQGTARDFAFSEGKGKLPPYRGYHKSPSSGWGSFNSFAQDPAILEYFNF
jgi:hypothetical protein